MSENNSKYSIQPGSNEQQPIDSDFVNQNYNTGYQYGATPNQPPTYQPQFTNHPHLITQTTIQCQPSGMHGQYNQSPIITHQPTRIWKAGLCNCCSDCGTCKDIYSLLCVS